MKLVYKITLFSLFLLGTLRVWADNVSNTNRVQDYIRNTYSEIDFNKNNKNDSLPFIVFEKAMYGYLNLFNAGKLNADKQILTICDFTKSANNYRLWIIDLKNKKLLFNTYVAHGQGTGEEFATAFSNIENSHQSSLGFYVTGETYIGQHGLSLYLHGVDNGYNDAAHRRSIVMHGADYVCKKFIEENKRLGRSWGCPAVPSQLAAPIIETVKDQTCLFIYYPDKKYLAEAYWINKKISFIPESIQPLTVPAPNEPKAAETKPLEIITLEEAKARGMAPLEVPYSKRKYR